MQRWDNKPSQAHFIQIQSQIRPCLRRISCRVNPLRPSLPWRKHLGAIPMFAFFKQASFSKASDPPANIESPSPPSTTQQSSPPLVPTHGIREVYENQRWLGTWQPPVAILDHPAWSDSEGNSVALTEPPSLDSPEKNWEVVITPSTDDQGWQYGTVFKHLQYKRAGGRASQRFGDLCRRRAWQRRDHGVLGSTLEPAAVVDPAVVAAREAEAKNKALRGFITMILDLLARRKVWNLLPWDPAALFFLLKTHQEVYKQLQTQAYQRQIFSADTDSPPSVLHPDGSGTLLQDLLCAAVHSRAAYGFAMAAGHITSVASYIKLQTVQPLSFNAVAGASIEANNEAVAALAGVNPSDILLSHWRNSSFRPCHYVAIDRINRCVVVSIRGTLEVGDLLSDLAAHPMEASICGVDGWVHQGILAAASYIHCTTEAALKDAAKQCPGWPVLITGHSLGGGVAALLCMLLRERGGVEGLGPVQAITVGSAAVMSESLAKAAEDYVISVVLGSDIIPHLSYSSVEKLLVEASEASPVRRAAEGLKKKLDQALSFGRDSASMTTVPQKIPIIDMSSGGDEEERNAPNPAGSSSSRLNATTSKKKKKNAIDNIAANSRNGVRSVPILTETSQEIFIEERPAMPAVLQYGGIEGDAGLASSAMAQESAARDPESMQIDDTHTQEQRLGDPECLFPPGRLLWVFPADEDLSSPPPISDEMPTIPEEAAEKVATAWDAAWEGGDIEGFELLEAEIEAGGVVEGGIGTAEQTVDKRGRDSMPLETRASVDENQKQRLENSKREPAIDESGINAKGPCTNVKSNVAAGKGAVNMDEAAAQVKLHGGKAEEVPREAQNNDTGGSDGKKVQSVPVVVEADRSAFERLLFMPDSINDHLPHRYLEALQQL